MASLTAPDPDLARGDETPEAPAWDRRAGETDRSYRAFATYRELGAQRSLRKAATKFYGHADVKDATEPQIHQCSIWSRRFSWVERVNAWDDYLEELGRVEAIEGVKEMRERHLTIAQFLLANAAKRLQEAFQEGDVSPETCLRAIDIGAKLEMISREVPTDLLGVEHSGTVIVEEEKAAWRERLDELAAHPDLVVLQGGAGA